MTASTGRRTFIPIVAVLIFIAVSVLAMWVHIAQRKAAEDEQSRRNQWVSEQKEALRSGKQSSVYFYCSSNTDELIAEFSKMPEIERLTFELTDLTDAGVRPIANLPNLADLTLYGGRPRVGDTGLQTLAGKQSIMTLKLINIDVTEDGLRLLASFPALTDLTLHRDGFREIMWTDTALQHIRQLGNLTRLKICGGWMSDTALEELRKDLPKCEIVTDAQSSVAAEQKNVPERD